MLACRSLCPAVIAASLLLASASGGAQAQGTGGGGGTGSGSGAGTSGGTAAPRATTPPPTTPPPPTGPAAPAPQVQGANPLPTPPVNSGPLGGGGSARTGTGTGTGTTGSGSAAIGPPSTPGGGGKALEDCMNFWDHKTHMSKREWRAACLRVQNRLEELRREAEESLKTLKRDREAKKG
jgi:hypothetical protein